MAGDGEEMRIESVRDEHHAVVRIVGELDVATAPALRDELDRLMLDGVDRVVLDCRAMGFVDSFGLGVIVTAKKRLSQIGNSLCLVAGPEQTTIRRLLEITGLDQLLPVHPTVADAVDDCLREAA